MKSWHEQFSGFRFFIYILKASMLLAFFNLSGKTFQVLGPWNKILSDPWYSVLIEGIVNWEFCLRSWFSSFLWSRQAKPFDISMSKAIKILLLLTDLFQFSNISRRYCWVVKPFRNLHWYFENIFSKICDICSKMRFKYVW